MVVWEEIRNYRKLFFYPRTPASSARRGMAAHFPDFLLITKGAKE
jgi:hypothetical protein